ncbi:MAG: aminoacyl-tRNA hydrolase [Thermodesulfobacteriota bacterium]|nr:aminoacyl-tRNA hydrolase [Thermodesulfobacteriota bacterium]
MKIIVGLGNPGVQFKESRHNIGFSVLDRLAKIHHISFSNKRFSAFCGMGSIRSQKVLLFKPMTFMNRSGEAVKKAIHFFESGLENLIIIHDDLDLPFGRLRFKVRGGDGGHLGVRSTIESLGANTFLRLRVGIGRPPKGMESADYVLSSFDASEQLLLNTTLNQAAEALKVMLLEGVQSAMNRFQKKIRTEEG